ncbi:MAG: metallophosphoesterase family protein [Acidobacteria bacterium]|nr:metallophosphoesterase family protein [Acidobacteriota bacterium]
MIGSMRRLLCALFSLAVWAQAPDLVGLYLTWNGDPATTMTVNWVDLHTATSLDVHYRRIGEAEWKIATGSKFGIADTTMQGRRVQLTGLTPDSNYEFNLGARIAKAGEGWRFRTMPKDLNRPVHFVAGGDMMHTRARVDKMNAVAGSLDPDFALLGGDLAYANGVSSGRWADWLKSWLTHSVSPDGRLLPMVLAMGNHEVKGGYKGKIPQDAPFFYSLFQTPSGKSYYAQDFGKYLSILVLDSDHTEPIAGPQAAWLESALAARKEQKFVFVVYHWPAYGTNKPPKGSDLPIDAPRSVEIRKEWMPHWEKYGVTAVFENDHHTYKRTYRLRQHKRDDENGILYLGDGAWAVSTRPVPKNAWWLAHTESRNHIFSVRLRAEGTASVKAVDIEGQVFDKIEIAKPRTAPVSSAPPSGQ